MRKVFKYEIQSDGTTIEAKGLIPIYVNAVGSSIYLWAEIDDTLPMVSKRFFVYPTGHMEIPDNACYVGSLLMQSGYLVWHVYETPASEYPES